MHPSLAFQIVLISSLLLSACGKENQTGYLEDPSLTPVSATSEFPSVVKVVLPEGRGLCTGTVISPRAVLTAAHCTLTSGAYRVVLPEGSQLSTTIEKFGSGELGDANDISIIVLTYKPAEVWSPISFEGVQYRDAVRVVGFGCDDLDSRLGTGVKRTGTNRVVSVGNFIETHTPRNTTQSAKILGPENLAGSCFGDSGGPMLRFIGDRLRVIGVAHAGGWTDTRLVSRYVNLNLNENRDFLEAADAEHSLQLQSACTVAPQSMACQVNEAQVGIASLVKALWGYVSKLWLRL